MIDKASPPHLFANVLARVHAVCGALAAEDGWPAGIDLSRVVVEPPRDAAHGDMATNAAMVLAKEAKAKPRDLPETAQRRPDRLGRYRRARFYQSDLEADRLVGRAAYRAARGHIVRAGRV